MPGDGEADPPPLPPEVIEFQKIIEACNRRPPSAQQQKFVKKKDCIPTVALPEEETCRSALNLADRGLIGQFTGLWPSPKSVEDWIKRNWTPLIEEGIKSYFVGKGFFVFVFELAEDRSLIFRNGPYFMGPQGLYLNKWSPDFDPTQDVPSAVPVWVRLPHLPLHCWSQKSLQIIGNSLGKYIDQAARKDQYSCARICAEVDLEEGLPEAIKLTVAGWSHIQELDYEQIPFKCRHCHGYGHFAKHCKKKSEDQSHPPKGDQWTTIQKTGNAKATGKGASKGNNQGKPSKENETQQKSDEITNPEEASPSDPPETDLITPALAEDPQANKERGREALLDSTQGSPSRLSYVDITKKNKVPEPSDSSEEETFEGPSKKAGRKTHKAVREEEAERLKMQGSQSTIEMTIGRNTRGRSIKGVIPNPSPGK